MARAIIHNSNYRSVEEAKGAINRYFDKRNRHFRERPRRAGRESRARSECRLSSLTRIAAKTRDSVEYLRSNVHSSEGPPIRRRPLSLLKQSVCFRFSLNRDVHGRDPQRPLHEPSAVRK
jgi:hypothetical protein